jgi:hypothetical protein
MRFEGPPPVLYAGRVRLDVPNRFGWNPHRPELEPPDRPDEAHHINRAAYAYVTDPRRRQRLRETLHRLIAMRKKRGTRDKPIRRKQGRYALRDLEVRQRDMRPEALDGETRLLAWCAQRCNWRTGEVGQYVGGQIRPLSRAAIAERSGFPVRIDRDREGRPRVRAYQLDRRIENGVVGGLLFRHEEKRSARTILKLTPLAWIKLGVAKLRQHYLRKEAKSKTRTVADYQREKAARRGEQRSHDVAQEVARLTRERTNDTDFTAPAERRGWPPRKPPS